MKKIEFLFQDGSSKSLVDNADGSIEEFTSELSKIFTFPNIVIIHATSGSIILRPSLLESIHVYDLEQNINLKLQEDSIPNEHEELFETTEDIITDMDVE